MRRPNKHCGPGAATHTPATSKTHSWLMVNIGADVGKSAWGLGCVLCRWAGEKGPYTTCTKRTLTKLVRHANTSRHMHVVQSWSNKAMTSGGEDHVPGGQTAEPVGGQTPVPAAIGGVGYGHILKMLEIFQEQ